MTVCEVRSFPFPPFTIPPAFHRLTPATKIPSPPPSSSTATSTTTATPFPPVLRYVLWFHEYDDLDVGDRQLAGREWDFGVGAGMKDGCGVVKLEKEEEVGDGVVTVKMEVDEGVVKIKDEEL